VPGTALRCPGDSSLTARALSGFLTLLVPDDPAPAPMTSRALSPSPPSYRPELIWNARHAFFDEGQAPVGLVHDAVLRSWARCSESGREVNEPVEFQGVDRQRVNRLLQAHSELLDVARPELADLAASVADAGYAVLLTDVQGNAIAVDGAIAQRSAPLRLAFRAGVDLSEAAIGTNAMAVAIREAQPVRVLGPEHFYTDAQIFHCSAAPVFDPQGEVIGAVDVSRDMPGMVDSTLWLAARCAQRIERRLFRHRRAHVHVEIDASSGLGAQAAGSGAWLAFGESGELMAANRAARSLLGLPPGALHLHFEGLFEERFGPWVSALRRAAPASPGVALRFQDGVRLRAVPLDDASSFTPAVPARVLSVAGPAARSTPTTPAPQRPALGDARLEREFERALRALRAGLPLLITGETGTGKEVAARALHAAGPRAAGPFVAINCAALPGELLASELFGHVEGAFTGSRRSGAAGKIEAAHGGTLLLDEIGDMPLALQVALLRVLDSKEVVRLGCHQPRAVDLSIVCATHRDLPERVAQGLFREDLMYRLAGHRLSLLPLREREDFDAVLDALLRRFGGEAGQVGAGLRSQLRALPWRGNVRQLALAVQRALALAEPGAVLELEDFGVGDEERPAGRASSSQPTGLLKKVTEQAIDEALRRAQGSVTRAARQLGIGRATLYRRLKQRQAQPAGSGG